MITTSNDRHYSHNRNSNISASFASSWLSGLYKCLEP